jgi:hypothetical protein
VKSLEASLTYQHGFRAVLTAACCAACVGVNRLPYSSLSVFHSTAMIASSSKLHRLVVEQLLCRLGCSSTAAAGGVVRTLVDGSLLQRSCAACKA